MQQLGERKKERRTGKREEGKQLYQRAEERKRSASAWRGGLKKHPAGLTGSSASLAVYPSPGEGMTVPQGITIL